jgi:hypothetical protein
MVDSNRRPFSSGITGHIIGHNPSCERLDQCKRIRLNRKVDSQFDVERVYAGHYRRRVQRKLNLVERSARLPFAARQKKHRLCLKLSDVSWRIYPLNVHFKSTLIQLVTLLEPRSIQKYFAKPQYLNNTIGSCIELKLVLPI